MRLSILDQSPISKGSNAAEALQNMEEAVLLAEKLGYHRFWMAEHHNTIGFSSSAPEISIAHMAAKTKRIRLGSGGVMMMHYSPYKLAEVFKTLSAYSPGRIDLGIGRAPGGDNRTIYAMQEGRPPMIDDMYGKLKTMLRLIADENTDDEIYHNMIAQPTNIQLPEAWLLGSSGNSALQAGRMGVGYSYAQFFNGHLDKAVIDTYKENFIPSKYMSKPEVMVSYFVTVAETAEEAAYQALPSDISRMLLMRGKIDERMSPEEAKNYPLTGIEKAIMQQQEGWHIKGTVKEVADRLREEQAYYGFDEAMICTIPFSQTYKLKEYRMLAEELL